jgi:hypothetical protein
VTSKPTAVIVDVDGTLCDITTALHHLNGETHGFQKNGRPVKRLDLFHAASALCPPNQVAIDYCVQAAEVGHHLIIVTARMEEWRDLTVTWLHQHLKPAMHAAGHYDRVCGPHMRRQDDYRPDVEIKMEIVGAIDDNPSVVQLWRSEGIPTTEVPRPVGDTTLGGH